MKFKDQENIQVHLPHIHSHKQCVTELVAISNEGDGVFVYFTDEITAFKFATNIAITSRRIELLLETIEIDTEDYTSYNELELIYSELKWMRDKFNMS